jgi:general secretion pathway protein G
MHRATKRKTRALNSGGFTLIELAIVVTIIGLLAVIIIPNYVKFADRAKETVLKENMHVIRTGMELYCVDHLGAYPGAAEEGDLEDLMPKQRFPTNPFTQNITVIAWDANPASPGDIGIIRLGGGGYEIKGYGRDGVLNLTITSGK